MPVPPPDLNRAFIEQLALGFPDQDLLRQAFEYDPGDVRGTAAASTNHRTGLQYHHFVQKAMRTEQQAGRSHRVTARSRPLHRSLPKWVNWLCETYPFTFTPSGAVVKKLQQDSPGTGGCSDAGGNAPNLTTTRRRTQLGTGPTDCARTR